MADRSILARVVAVLLLSLAIFPALGASDPAWFTRVWQTDDGLIDNDINGIVQGPDEYLWLVTPVGLMKFDGVNFETFSTDGFASPTANHVRMMLCSRTRVLWLAFDGGKIIGLKPDSSLTVLDGSMLPTRAPSALVEDDQGALWLGYSDVIYRYHNGKIDRLSATNGVPPGALHALADDGAGEIWLAKGSEVSCFRAGKFSSITNIAGVQCMAATHTNAIWLVANAHLFSCGGDGILQDFGAFQDPSDVRAVSLLEDHAGSVWIGTEGNGLFRYYESRFARMDTSHPSILSLAEDHEGNIWAGTGGGGLNRLTRCGVRLEVLENNKMQSQLQSLCQDAGGVFWGATQNGTLVARTSSGWLPMFTNAPFAGTVTCVAADHSRVWVGTREGKLLEIAGTNGVIWETNISRGSVRGILVASPGYLLAACSDALKSLYNGRLRTVRLPRQFQGVYALAEDKSGNIWMGANGLLLRLNEGKLSNETPLLRMAGAPICCLYCTADGSLWIGSRNGGLMRLKNGIMDQIGLAQGLADNYISQMVADGHGWLWFASKHGVFKLRQHSVEEAMENHDLRLRPIIYGKNEGLISQEAVFSIASPFILPRAVLSDDGMVWMLMHKGIVVADPNSQPETVLPPPILLTQVVMDGKTLFAHDGTVSPEIVSVPATPPAPLKIPPSHRRLEFDFTAFNFRAPENLHFRYQLVGYDNGWIDARRERAATYSRLPAGKYQFRVAASVGDGPWNEPPAGLAFIVVPFFWQTWWFSLGAVLIATLSLIAIVRYVSYRRLRLKLRAIEQLAAVERERGRIARDIHDDLGNRLTEIQLLTGLAQKNADVPKTAFGQIHEIASAARQATDALDEIVWAINPRNDTLPHLINYLGQFTTDYMRTAGIRCLLDLPENPPAQSVSAEVRHNLFLAIKEALNNIARHSGATEVSLRILVTDETLGITIQDNGRGFSGEVKHQWADGLENMRRRIVEIGGQFDIKSAPGAGTGISFTGRWLTAN